MGNLEANYRFAIPRRPVRHRARGLRLHPVVACHLLAQQRRSRTSSPAAAAASTSNNPRQNEHASSRLFGNYARRIESWSSDIDLTAGYTYEYSNGDYPSFYAEKLSDQPARPQRRAGCRRVQQNFFNVQESKLISGFARAELHDQRQVPAHRQRCAVTARRASGPATSGVPSPRSPLAWRLIDESFIKDHAPLSDLKLRYCWGVNGNQSFAQLPVRLHLPTANGAGARCSSATSS